MKILVINIALRPSPSRKWPPVGLGYIATAMKNAGFDFELLDLDIHPQPEERTEFYLKTHQFDVILMGCIVTGYKYVNWLCSIIKGSFPNTTIIVGNTVASSIPEILLSKTPADIAVIGEGDITVIELLKSLQNKDTLENIAGIYYKKQGAIKSTASRKPIENIDEVPFPDWDLFDIEAYIQNLSQFVNDPLPPIPKDSIRAMPINTARGCPFKCTFCYHAFREYKYRQRSPESIINEMLRDHNKYGINYFSFGDELTFYSLHQAEKFAEKLEQSGLKVYWHADCRSGLFVKNEDVEIAKKLKNVGCISLSYSLESANPDILKWMNKKVGPDLFGRQVEILKRAGLPSLTSIVVGYPNETKETIKATIDCCIANGIYPSAGYLLPQPGSEMYDYAKEKGYISDEEAYLMSMGDRQDLHINMTQMSDEELVSTVKSNLLRCARELGIGLKDGELLKTGFYRTPNQKSRSD